MTVIINAGSLIMDQQQEHAEIAVGPAVLNKAAVAKPRRTRRLQVDDLVKAQADDLVKAKGDDVATAARAAPDEKIAETVARSTPQAPEVDMAPARKTRPINIPVYAAALCITLGVGGVLGSQMKAPRDLPAANEDTASIERVLPWKRDVAEAVTNRDAKLRDDLRALRGEVAALRANNDQLRQAEREKQTGDLRAVRAMLEAQKAETAALKADMAARLDRADRDGVAKTDKVAERVDRLEKRLADPMPTATTLAKTVAEPAKAERAPVKGIFLRDAARGVALLETRRGLLEVVPGDTVPGAGRVESIEKHAGKWRVFTTNGVIDASSTEAN